MNISLLDPGLGVLAGHHFDLDLRIVRELTRCGHEVTVHGYVQPNPALVAMAEKVGMTFHQTFRVFPYLSPGQTPSTPEAYQTLELATAQDLVAVSKTDLWLWPTLAPYQLAAAAHHGGPVRQIGGVWWLPRKHSPMGAASWAASARKLAGRPHRIVVGAYDELLCQGYQDFSPGLDLACLPCPHDGVANTRRPDILRRIGFFGHQRPDRGIELIPELVAALVSRGYEVVVQDSSGSVKSNVDDSRIRVIEYIDDFPSEIAQCDVVIWPSHWESYTDCLSGVVSESIATGVPVIVPSGCMPAQIAARYRCGVSFHNYSKVAILDAVADAARDFSGLSARAREAAIAWHARNGTDHLAAWIEQEAGAMA